MNNFEIIGLICIIVLVISLIASITIYFRKDAPTYLKLFPPFLFLAAVIQIIGFRLASLSRNNHFLLEPFMMVEFEFYFFILLHFFRRKQIRNSIFFSMIVCPILFLVDLLYLEDFEKFNSYSYCIGALLIVFFSFLYLLGQFDKQTSRRNTLRDPSFWISVGLFSFYGCSLPISAALNFISHFSYLFIEMTQWVLLISNVVLYSSFTIAFLCVNTTDGTGLFL